MVSESFDPPCSYQGHDYSIGGVCSSCGCLQRTELPTGTLAYLFAGRCWLCGEKRPECAGIGQGCRECVAGLLNGTITKPIAQHQPGVVAKRAERPDNRQKLLEPMGDAYVAQKGLL